MDVLDLLEQRQEIREFCGKQFFHRRLCIDDKAKYLGEDIAFREPDFFRINSRACYDRVDQILLIFAIHDREPARITERAPVTSQDSVPHRMERPAPKPARIDREQIRDAIQHLSGGFIREGEQQNISRIDSVFEQVRNPVGECARFATACARDHEQRTGRSRYSRKLLFIQLCRVIDVDRCRCWRALERVLAGHNACPVRQSDGFVQWRTRTRLRCGRLVRSSTEIWERRVSHQLRRVSSRERELAPG